MKWQFESILSLKFSRALSAAFVPVFLFSLSSCRKDHLVNQDRIAFDAKAWYAKQTISKSVQPSWQFQQSGIFGNDKIYRVPVKRTEWVYITLKNGNADQVRLQIVKTDEKISPIIHLEWYDAASETLYKKAIPKDKALKPGLTESSKIPLQKWLSRKVGNTIKDIATTKKSPGRPQPEYGGGIFLFDDTGGNPPQPPCAHIIQLEGDGTTCFEDDGTGNTGSTNNAYDAFYEPHYLLETNLFYSYGKWTEFFQEYPEVIDFYEQNGYFSINDPGLPADLKYLLNNYYSEIVQEVAYLKAHPQFVLYSTDISFLYGTAFSNITKKALLSSPGAVLSPTATSLLKSKIAYITSVLNLDIATQQWLYANENVVERTKDFIASHSADFYSISKAHIANLMSNSGYLNFVNNYNLQGYNQMWWENEGWLDDATNYAFITNNGYLTSLGLPNISEVILPALLDTVGLTPYPKFKNIVTRLPDFLNAYPNVKKAIAYYTGFTEKQVMAKIQPGVGPHVQVINNLTNSFGQSIYGHYNAMTKTLEVNGNFVNGLEVAQLPQTIRATALLLAITTFHEFIHYGRRENHLSEKYLDPNTGTLSEAGWIFEMNIPPGGIIIGKNNALQWLNYYPYNF